jgi:hypothetical protein
MAITALACAAASFIDANIENLDREPPKSYLLKEYSFMV